MEEKLIVKSTTDRVNIGQSALEDRMAEFCNKKWLIGSLSDVEGRVLSH